VEEMYTPKLIMKYLSPKARIISELKKKMTVDPQAVLGKTPVGFFSGMNAEFRQKIADAGIDIYTGAFKKTATIPKGTGAAATVEDDNHDISIQYVVEGQDLKKMTYAKILEYEAVESTELPTEVAEVIKRFDSITNVNTKLKEAYAENEKAEKRVEEIARQLWMHKCSMFLKGNKTNIHTDDKNDWELNTKKKSQAKVYNCTAEGCEGLMIAVINVDIR